MSSEKTPNLNLHKWQGTDSVKREEFNENFQTIDTAINELKNSSGTASKINITDSGNYFQGTTTEEALQELAKSFAGARSNLLNSVNSLLNS